MAKYWYRIQLSPAVKAEELESIKNDLMQLFCSTDVPKGMGDHVEVSTPLDPLAARSALDKFSASHGLAYFVGGSKVE